MTDLKPCPFCGGEAEQFPATPYRETAWIVCKTSRDVVGPMAATAEEAAKLGNTRPAEESGRQQVGVAVAALEAVTLEVMHGNHARALGMLSQALATLQAEAGQTSGGGE